MDLLNWIETINHRYYTVSELIENQNSFTAYEYHITDPYQLALGFRIFLNDQKRVSAFTTDVFDFGWLNIAEGVREDQIMAAALCCLEGNLHFRKGLFGKVTLEFDAARGKLRRGLVIGQKEIEGFLHGYVPKS
jgi:hypothetical protein